MRIIVKAAPEYFAKERDGRKPNTIRYWPVTDDDHSTYDTIEVVEVDSNGKPTGQKFERQISDISCWQGMMLISWKHEKEES